MNVYNMNMNAHMLDSTIVGIQGMNIIRLTLLAR